MSTKHRLLKATRLTHLYLGVFITPALIFFAFTGFVQTFSLHETTRGSSYQPPAILVKLGQLHKKQTLVVPVRKPQPPAPLPADATSTLQHDDATRKHHADENTAQQASSAAPAPKMGASPAKSKNLLPMKLFFALVSVGLFISTLTGLYMSYKYVRQPKSVTALWIAGIVIPVLLTLF